MLRRALEHMIGEIKLENNLSVIFSVISIDLCIF